LELAPDLALALFVAPVLLDAAFDTSPRELRATVVPLIAWSAMCPLDLPERQKLWGSKGQRSARDCHI
jgi:hypothetical protein